jgi:hypothetical protein
VVLGAESVEVILYETEYVSTFLCGHVWHSFMILYSLLNIAHVNFLQGRSLMYCTLVTKCV